MVYKAGEKKVAEFLFYEFLRISVRINGTVWNKWER